MSEIFISTLPVLLESWIEAFPSSTLAREVPKAVNELVTKGKAKTTKSESTTFWLHMNEDRQQWMENGIATIKQNYKGAKIVILANVPNHAESIHALSLGAMGYCHAYIAPAVLKEIKAVITHGGLWIGQDILQSLIEVSTKLVTNTSQYVDGLLAKLTKREREVATEAAKGLSNKEIARVLSITERTVKAHLASVFERLGAKDRLQLALMLNGNYKPS
jgi:DNA-binding NarL/FixJ family response regulator